MMIVYDLLLLLSIVNKHLSDTTSHYYQVDRSFTGYGLSLPNTKEFLSLKGTNLSLKFARLMLREEVATEISEIIQI